jgi:hypothetical protein
MANGTRTLAVALALVAGLGVGWLIGHGQTPSPPPPTPTPVATAPAPAPTSTRVPRPIVTPAPPFATAKPWNVTVGPHDPCKVTDQDGQPADIMVISKHLMHSITFRSTGAEKLGILLHVPADSPQPFKNVAYVGFDPNGWDVWTLQCDKPRQKCVTGPAEADAPYYVKVDQILDRQNPCDAGIIIQP